MDENEIRFYENKEKGFQKNNSYKDILNTKKNWKDNNEINMADIIKRIKIMQSKLKYSYNKLLDENNDRYKKSKSLMTLSEDKNNIDKKNTIDKISPFTKMLLKKANTKINEVNQSALNIARLNYLYYLHQPSNDLGNKSCDEKTRNKKNRVKSSIINERKDKSSNDNINNNTIKNEDNIIKKIKSKSLLKNFVYINNNYHKQLNSAFMKYNPTAHLSNMKILLQACPYFQEDISREKKDIENDIDFKNDKFKFKKKYLNYLNKQQLLSINKPKIIIKPKIKKNMKRSVSLPKIKIKDQTEDKKINIPIIFMNRLKNNKGEEFKKFKDKKIEELHKLISISGEIDNFIAKDNIDKKIKKFMNDYNIVRFEAENNINKENDIDLNKIDYFKSEKSIIDKKLESFYLKKYFNSIEKKEKNLFNKLNSEFDIFENKNINNRDNSLNELDCFLLKNNINIFEE